jgi:CDP-diacylglycerol--serine O-phosphatidyltransferase
MFRKLPANIVTSGNLFCGLFSVLSVMDGHPVLAAWFIVMAAVLDAFDGKAARFFGGGSDFGVQFDSLADMVSFGLAPAVLLYGIAFDDLGFPGLVVTFVPVLAVAIRLARFNVAAARGKTAYVGLSSPLHACLMAAFVVMSYSRWGEILDSNVLAALVLISSLLMVSHLPLPALPRFTLREPGYNLAKMIFLIAAVVYMAINPARHAFPALTVLIVSAFVVGGILAIMGSREIEDDEEDGVDDDTPEHAPSWIFRGRR